MEELIEARIGRYLSGEMTVLEREAFEQEMAANPELNHLYTETRRIWAYEPQYIENQWDTDKALARFAEPESSGRPSSVRNPRRLLMWSAAAVVVLLIGAYGLLFNLSKPITYAYQEGSSDPIELKDGSKIYLNKASNITVYPFTRQSRHVELEGEAFFEVQPDKKRPFTITSGKTMTEVVGTSFTIKQLPGQTHIYVSSGKIIFSSIEDGHNAVALTEGEGAVFESSKIQLIPNPSPNINAWRTHQLRFVKMPLEAVVADVSAYFDQKILVENDASKTCPITIPLAIGNPEISSVLKLVAACINAKLVKEGDTYIIRGGRTCP